MELRTTESLIYVYNVTLKFTRELEDISATAYTGQSVRCLGKCNHVGAILFALEDYNRKKNKNFCRTFDVFISVIKMECYL